MNFSQAMTGENRHHPSHATTVILDCQKPQPPRRGRHPTKAYVVNQLPDGCISKSAHRRSVICTDHTSSRHQQSNYSRSMSLWPRSRRVFSSSTNNSQKGCHSDMHVPTADSRLVQEVKTTFSKPGAQQRVQFIYARAKTSRPMESKRCMSILR